MNARCESWRICDYGKLIEFFLRQPCSAHSRDEGTARNGVVELAALSALATLGCIVAAGLADLLFVALFGAASTVAITEMIRRLR